MALTYSPTAPVDFNSTMPWAGMRRCLLLDNRTVNYYLDANDSTKKADGTLANLTGADGQVMVEIPKFWFKKEAYEEAGKKGFRFYVSTSPKEGYEVHPAFFRDLDGDGIAEEVNFRYYGAFEGYTSGGKLESTNNRTLTVNQTIGTFRTQAEARGTGWGLTDFNLLYALQVLYLVEHGHFDSQTKIGKGVTSVSAKINAGATLALGNQTGNQDNDGASGLKAMSYRGIENWYGNVYEWIDGVVTDTSGILVGNKGFNDTGTDYQKYSVTIPNAGGYVSDIQGDAALGFIGSEFSGSATSKLYDYGYLYSGRVCCFGGGWTGAASAGALCVRLSYAASYAFSLFGGRLVC